MKNTKLIATVIVAGMLVTGCGFGGKAIIKINDQAITQSEFNKAMDKQISMSPFAKMGGDIKSNKGSMLYLMTEKAVLNRLITQKIFDQELKNSSIKVSNKEVNEAINKIIDKLGSKENLNKLLKQNGVSVKDFKADIKNQVKLKKLAKQSADVNVTDNEVKAFYNNNKSLFTHPEQVRAYHILLPTNRIQVEREIQEQSRKELSRDVLRAKADKEIAKNKELAEKLAKELKADSSKFEAYAKKYSKDLVSAQRGGDLGYFEKDKMLPQFSNAAFAVKPNTVVGPVATDFGLHIIYVADRKAAGTETFDQVKSDIKERLASEKEFKTLDNIMKASKKKSKIEFASDEYNPEVVDKKLQSQMQQLQKSIINKSAK